ncbi:MAG: DUF1559 domain-containing protein [Planctomycetaceae bacterium]
MQRFLKPQQLLLTLSVFIAMCATTTTVAQNNASNTKPIEAYLDAQTTVVGWADLSQFDLDQLAEFAKTLNAQGNDLTQAKAVKTALVQLGVTRMYWISDLAGLTQGPRAFVVPAPDDTIDAVTLILKTLAEGSGGTAVVDGSCVVVGDKSEIANLRERSGTPDAEFLVTVNRLKHPHAIALKTPVATLVPVMSVLPEIFGSADPRVTQAAELLVNVKAVTLSGLLPPSSFELQIQTKSPESAEGISSLINEWTTSEIKAAATPIQMKADESNVVLASNSLQSTTAMIDSLKTLTSPARLRAQRMSTLNSFKQIALAMHNFHDSYGHLPPQSLVGKDGKRLLSWRVLILPYLDNAPLYQEFHLDEPWDSPHNIKLVSKMPRVYDGSQTDEAAIAAGKTRMVAPLTKDSAFGRSGGGMTFQSILDGTSNTLMIVEAAPDQAVIWTKPEDVEIPAENPLTVLLDAAAKGFHACLCDGSARLIPGTIDAATLNALLSIDGKEIVDFGKL